MDSQNNNNTSNINMTNSIYTFAEKYGELCGNIFSGIINFSADITANSIGVFNASYNGFKEKSQPAIDNLIQKCQKVLDNKSNKKN